MKMTHIGRDYSKEKAQVRDAVESFLRNKFAEYPDTEVRRAAEHAVLGGGHRWRAIVTVAAGKISNEDAFQISLPAACGVELAHAASLVLDDLPSMDDGRTRRGKPCTHLVFPQWAVDLTPTFLITMCYAISLDNERSSPERRISAALELSSTGMAMIAGQTTDIKQEYPDEPSAALIECYTLKSAALFGAAAKVGTLLCGTEEDDYERISKAGFLLGLSYQLMDDVADVTASEGQVGKDVSQDLSKLTSINLFGVDGARRQSQRYQAKAIDILKGYGPEAGWLRSLIMEAGWKNY